MNLSAEFSAMINRLKSSTLHSTPSIAVDNEESIENTTIDVPSFEDDNTVFQQQQSTESPVTPINRVQPHYHRNSRLVNQPFRRI